MVPGHASNTSDHFPMVNELQQKCYEFFRGTCQDLFFDVLTCELKGLEDIERFFKETLSSVQNELQNYFEPSESLLTQTIVESSVLDGNSPLRAILNKSYQSNSQKIYKKCFNKVKLKQIIKQIYQQFQEIDEDTYQTLIQNYIEKLAEICLQMRISDPQFSYNLNEIGQQDEFSQLRHECTDGFLKARQQCKIILPAIYKIQKTQINSHYSERSREEPDIYEQRDTIMMSDIKLKIRHAKRGNEKSLDLSGYGFTELPIDITQLTMLERLNVSNNKLLSLKRVEQLPNLKEINASNNNISQIHKELQDMFSIETLVLEGNPIANSQPTLARIEKNQSQLKTALETVLGSSSSSSFTQLPAQENQNFGGISPQQNSFGSNFSGGYSQPTTASFLQSDSNMNDPTALRKRIAELELENKKLKDTDSTQMGSNQFSHSMNPKTSQGSRMGGNDKNWMNFSKGPLERPTTASTQNQKVNELQEGLKLEKKEQKKLYDEIENLKKELQKSNFSAFTQTSGQISVSAGRLPQVPGVREIQLDDIEIGEQISQGGFSVIHKGKLNGTPVAIKKIFDPRLTDDLLYEIYNEIVMQSILRHPNIALLMGVMPKIPNIVIVFEYVQGSLYNLLHIKKSSQQLLPEERLRIAREIAQVFQYMHALGIVHRDIKSHNILIDEHLNIKVCDFGLARFKADLNKGSMQYSGTPAYMAPELFQKRQYDESVDIFAFGTLLWELISREVPYDGLDPSDIRGKVEKEEPLKIPYGTDPKLAQLINDCRQANTSQRPRFNRILEVLNQISK